jgi:regulator of protease activity HflC (stomatin/prohibitin superfamily)
MAIGVILGILSFAAACGAFVCSGIMLYKGNENKKPNTLYHSSNPELGKKQCKNGAIGIVLGAVLLIVFLCIPFSFYTVDTGEVVVVKHLGVVKEVKQSGTYFDFWMTNKLTRYDAKVQTIPVETAAYSSDAQTMTIAMNLQYQIYPDKVMEITSQYGSLEALQTRVESVATERIKSVMSSYKAMDIIAKRAEMPALAEEAIRAAVDEDFYIKITTVAITNIDFSDAFEKAVEDKMIAEQAKLKADYENETKLAKAEADAAAKITTAEAEAKANELLEKTLTDKILREMYLEKWDGKLPEVVAGEDTGIMFSLDDEE